MKIRGSIRIGYSALSAEVADEYNDRVEEVGEDEDKSLEVPPSGGSTRRSGGGGRDRGRAPVWDGTIQDVETKKWVNEATKYAKEFAEREKKYLAEKGVLEVYKELLKIATLDELDAMAKYLLNLGP